MAKSSPAFQQKLTRIAEIKRAHPASAESDLRALLADADGHVAGLAVEAAAELRLDKLSPDLTALFHATLGDPKRDVGFMLSRKIVETLTAFETPAKDLYLLALRTSRNFGGRDPAAGLRIAATRALAQVHYREAVLLLVEAMVDPVPEVQVAALLAIGSIASEAATALLTYKLLLGGSHVDTMGACMTGLLNRDIERTLPMVSRYLENEDENLVEAAALALGDSREPAALLPLLRAFDPSAAPRVRQTMLVAIALLRQQAGTEFLLKVLHDEKETVAVDTLPALAIVRHLPEVENRVRATVKARNSPRLTQALANTLDRR
jgi:HEAT repeat protein